MNLDKTISKLVIFSRIETIKIDILKTNRLIIELILKDITYLPKYLYNLLEVSKLIKESSYTKSRKLIYLRKGKEIELYIINNNLYLIITNKSS